MLVYLGEKKNPTDYYVIEIETPIEEIQGPIVEDNVAVPEYASGRIYNGIVSGVRKYVFNFSISDFNPSFTTQSSYSIVSQSFSFNETITFTVGSPISITRTYPVRGQVYVGPVLDPFSDPVAAKKRQDDYFLKYIAPTPEDPGKQLILFQTEDITGSREFTIYGSADRVLRNLRHSIFNIDTGVESEKVVDKLVGTYYRYFPNGNIQQIKSYKNPTLTGNSLLDGDYFEYYENGTTKVSAHFTNNYLNGIYKQFYPSGFLQTNCTIVNGILHGTYYQYTREGTRDFVADYRYGNLEGSIVYKYNI